MADQPYVLLSAAVSVDGYLDDTGPHRLILSGPADLDRVDGVRAASDAILVGAGTIRRDDPRLLIRDPGRRAGRSAAGRPADPVRVTLTATGDLDPGRRFFTTGDPPRLVYAPQRVAAGLAGRLAGVATVVSAGGLPAILRDLAGRGVRQLLVEGGGTVLTGFLRAGLGDELQLYVAPFLVGDPAAPRLVGAGPFQWRPGHPMRLAEARRIDDGVLLRYLLSQAAVDRHFLAEAITEAASCPPAATAFSVGALLVDADGQVIARGHSRETDPHVHAEEAALAKLDPSDPRLPGTTLYSSLEPCSVRASRPHPCAELIRAAGIRRVVYAWREPPVFVDGRGAEELTAAGVTVVEVAELADAARAVNAHLAPPPGPAAGSGTGSARPAR